MNKKGKQKTNEEKKRDSFFLQPSLSLTLSLPLLPIELRELRSKVHSHLPQRRLIPSVVAASAVPFPAAEQAPPRSVFPLGQLREAQAQPAFGRAEVAGALRRAVGPGEAPHDGGEWGSDQEAVGAELRASSSCSREFFFLLLLLLKF